MSQEDNGASELNHPEETLWVAFPANDDAAKVMKSSEQGLVLPTAVVATQTKTVLCRWGYTYKFVRCDELHTVALLDMPICRIAVVSTVTSHSPGSFPGEALLERRFNDLCFMRRGAGHEPAKGRPWPSAFAISFNCPACRK
jgi:hypothetical protein